MADFLYLDAAREVPHLGRGLGDAYQNHGLGGALLMYPIGLGRHVLRKRKPGLTV